MSVHDDLEEYDAKRREEAGLAGRPLPRLRDDTVLTHPELGIIYTAGASRLRYVGPDSVKPTPLRTGQDILDLFQTFSLRSTVGSTTDPTEVLLECSHGPGRKKDRSGLPVVASQATLGDIVAILGASDPILDESGYDRIETTIRQIRVLAQLENRRRVLPILTNALATAYWMPDDLDEDAVGDWLTAFDEPSNSEGLLALLSAVNDRSGTGEGTRPTWFDSVGDAEVRVWSVAKYRNYSAENDTFLAAETHSQVRSVLHASDSGLLERSILEGTLHPLEGLYETDQVTSQGKRLYAASAADDFDVKEGRKVSLLAGTRPRASADAAVARIETDDEGSVVVMLEGVDQKDKHIRRVLGGDCLLMQTPFTGSLRASGAPRWQTESIATGRTVPMDVLVAGSG